MVGDRAGTCYSRTVDDVSSFPEYVLDLVLISGYYYPTARLDVALSAPAAVPLLGDAQRYTVSPVIGRLLLKRIVKAMFAPAPVPEDFFDAMPREMMLRPFRSGLRRRTPRSWFPRRHSFAITIPTSRCQ